MEVRYKLVQRLEAAPALAVCPQTVASPSQKSVFQQHLITG